MDKKTDASTANPAQKASTSSTPTDDESSISISTESELFETWTMVKDKNKKNPTVTVVIDDDCKSIEMPDEDKLDEQLEGQEHDEPKPDNDSNIDDLSDGISIISESESGGRVSPHPFLREHLNNLHLQCSSADVLEQSFSEIPTLPLNAPVLPSAAAPTAATLHSKCDDIIDYYSGPSGSGATIDNQLLRQRRRKRSTSSNNLNTSDQKALPTVESIVSIRHIPPIVQRSLAGIFYVGVALAILALIGKLHYPEWRPLSTTSDSKSMAALEQKLTDMELQNNLMRAEIDILSKQVHYLSDLKENNRGNRVDESGGRKEQFPSSSAKQQQPKRPGEWVMEHKGGKTFKAWSGNGKSMQSVGVTKDDLKRPYKCPNGNYVEIAGMCVEDATVSISEGDKEKDPALIDQIGNIINHILTKSETYETVKATDDELHSADTENEEQTNTAPEGAKLYSLKDEHKEDKRTDRREEKYQKNSKRFSYTSAENRAAANSKEHGKYEKRYQYQKHQHKHHEHDDDDDDNDDHDDHSEEEVYKKHDNQRNHNDHTKKNSKERFDKQQQQQRRKFSTSSEEQRFHKDGQWHEKLMQQRENVRRKNEHLRNDKNWYIERGNSREQMRHS